MTSYKKTRSFGGVANLSNQWQQRINRNQTKSNPLDNLSGLAEDRILKYHGKKTINSFKDKSFFQLQNIFTLL